MKAINPEILGQRGNFIPEILLRYSFNPRCWHFGNPDEAIFCHSKVNDPVLILCKMSKTPTVLWAQRTDRILISIQLEDVSEEKITVDTEKLAFSGISNKETYTVELNFHGNIVPEESKQRKGGREYYFDLKKKEDGPYWPRLLKDKVKHQNIKIDFNRWKDEDDTDDETPAGMYDDASLEDMMAQMGGGAMNGGGMPPGMGAGGFDPGDAPDSEDSDDEDIPDLEDDAGNKVEE